MGMANEIPAWILQCLDQYGNCACGYTITKQYGEEKLLSILKDKGYPCKLEILTDVKDEKYPKDATYILISQKREAVFDREG